MDNSPSARAGISAGTQLAICLLTVLAIGVGCVLVNLAARNDAINDWFFARQIAKWKSTNSKYQYNRGYIDFDGRLLYGDLPTADYSKGGVYFVGSSTVVNSLIDWELPPEQRALIHNYSFGGAKPAELNHFVRYLIEDNNLLKAGPEKTTIVFGLFFDSFSDRPDPLNERFLKSIFSRHGLYDYSPTGIRPTRISPLTKIYLTEKARCANFLHYAFGHLAFREKPLLSEDQKQRYHEMYVTEQKMPNYENGLENFGKAVDYLRSKGVRVAAYFVPLGSWYRGKYGDFPIAAKFHKEATEYCQKKNVPVLDLEALLDDDEFFDAGHANYAGQKKQDGPLVNLALENLYESGVLPRPEGAAIEPAPNKSDTKVPATN